MRVVNPRLETPAAPFAARLEVLVPSSQLGPPGSSERALATLGGVTVAEHDHLCVLYRGRSERDRLIFDHLEEGLRAGDTCLYVTTEGNRDGFRAALADDAPDVDLGWLEVREPSSTHLNAGEFSPDGMLALIEDWSRETFAREECRFARAAADMSWALPHVSNGFISDLVSYEARVARWTRAYRQIGVFLYDLDRFGGDLIVSMVNSHPKVLINGVIVENPYSVDPCSTAATGS
jgi:hypothetical protein